MSAPVFGDSATIRKLRRPNRGPVWAEQWGRGPAAETCGTCRELVRIEAGNSIVFKCRMHPMTSSYASDIRRKDPACIQWEPAAARGEVLG